MFIKLTADNGGNKTLVHVENIDVIRSNRKGGVDISMRFEDFARSFTESLETVEGML